MDKQVINFEEQAMTPLSLKRQVNLIQECMKEVMQEGEHYGKIPGCGDKPTLLKPGAEKLCTTFRLAPSYQITKSDLKNNHREYEIVCTLTHINSGVMVGQGVGSCSTMEGKFRFRTGESKPTGRQVPQEYWTNRDQNLLGGKGFTTKKINGKWEVVLQGEKIEHDNPADYYNTVLKIAKKRAHVDAVLTATAASDIFAQDIEDMKENELIIINNDNNETQVRAEKAEIKKEFSKEDYIKGIGEMVMEMASNDKELAGEFLNMVTGFEIKDKETGEKKTIPGITNLSGLDKFKDSRLMAVYGKTKNKHAEFKLHQQEE